MEWGGYRGLRVFVVGAARGSEPEEEGGGGTTGVPPRGVDDPADAGAGGPVDATTAAPPPPPPPPTAVPVAVALGIAGRAAPDVGAVAAFSVGRGAGGAGGGNAAAPVLIWNEAAHAQTVGRFPTVGGGRVVCVSAYFAGTVLRNSHGGKMCVYLEGGWRGLRFPRRDSGPRVGRGHLG